MATVDLRSKPANSINVSAFVDTASCYCALRSIAEEVLNHSKTTQAWRCTAGAIEDSLAVSTGKWYYPALEGSDVKSKHDVKVMAHQLPDSRTWFTATLMEGQPLPVRSFDHSRLSTLNKGCTGEMRDQIDTTAERPNHLLGQRAVKKSSKGKSLSEDVPPTGDETLNDQSTAVGTVPSREDLSRDGETFGEEKSPAKKGASSDNGAPKENPPSSNNNATREDSPEYKYLHSCLGGDQVVAVQMQNDTSWKAQGCLPGFLCKCGRFIQTP
ncbi:MAG: hypothetical protein Q9182_001730 [Xanthomendoza sp. 2 TL-2023]